MKNLLLQQDIITWCINNERCMPNVMDQVYNESAAETTVAATAAPPPTSTPSKRELERIEFYKTYDVMTGVRIAATLGGFFGLMVILVVYKSKSKTERALEDPRLAAAAVAEVEEEERQMAAALEANAYEELNPRRTRRSLDTSSVSPRWIRNTTRFSSIGGYSSLLEPPVRMCSKLPCSIDEDSPPEDSRMYDDVYAHSSHLDVPSRRASNITCSSSGSSYLERRGSSVVLGLPAVPAHKMRTRRRQSSPLPEHYDFYYPIDIRVIQPTPGGSPCGSERALYDEIPAATGTAPTARLTPRLAPLASISSCNSSLANDYPDLDIQSYASDSVFHELEYCEDTDDEVDPFSTDSDESDDDAPQPCCSKDCRIGRSFYEVEEEEEDDIQIRTPSSSLHKTSTTAESTAATTSRLATVTPSDTESTSTLVAAGAVSIALAESACAKCAGSLPPELWSQETLF